MPSAARSPDPYRGKRLLDVLVAGTLLLLTWPVLLLIALAVRVQLGSPVLFRQVRPGFQGAPFTLLKFRTMRDLRDASGELLPDAARLSRFGQWLRATSLDELPELLNVLRGDMSLIGPRPLLLEYLPRYDREQARRHDVRPGLTGWAQVNGRHELSWEDRFTLDVWYVTHASLLLDLRIALRTATQISRRAGVRPAGHPDTTDFLGTAPHLSRQLVPAPSHQRTQP
ncbi:sugar transferase [Deinococcus radiotolerans]|uniref:UDP-phosphate galactose phosphotransferase n=1 Tax=Deinococcus radiotolerans TaxID=1309407 RepID=A0ABQ2FMB6_9DEIO|nr:sugar transferase [Deinococcus radiotolerans]GGL09636.1 UDP-phosphate galactose phosphotransferase [Deinococcus radiotolerans]